MSKAEKFISDYTRNCSNELIAVESRAGKEVVSYHEWLTPDQARKAVEIAREEMIERALIAFQVVCNRPAKLLPNCEAYCNTCKLFKQAIKDE